MAAELEGRYLISLVRSLLLEKPLEPFAGDWGSFCRVVSRHSMAALAYDVLKANHVAVPQQVEQRLREARWKAVAKEGTFQYEYECMAQEFQKLGIRMMPLKGLVMKHYYPQMYQRSMSDMDILVPLSAQEAVKNSMTAMGYTVESYGGNVDVYHKQPVVNVEIHHELFESVHDVWRHFFQKVTNQARTDENGVGRLGKEDMYLYLLAHMAKHFKNGGSGIRPVLDTWLYLREEAAQFDWEYVNSGLKELGLVRFEERIRELGEYWMNPPKERLEIMERLTDFVIGNGIYGTQGNLILNNVNHEAGGENMKKRKLKTLWKKCFPSMESLKNSYPILNKWPVMLPVVQLRRIWRVLTRKESRSYVTGVIGATEKEAEKLDGYMKELFGEW